MPRIPVDGVEIHYRILGDGPPLVLTPGGRFPLDVPGLRPLAEALAERYTVLLWDRPNTGGSDVRSGGCARRRHQVRMVGSLSLTAAKSPTAATPRLAFWRCRRALLPEE